MTHVKHNSAGMTLVELMVAVAITAVVMTLSITIFLGQYKSYGTRIDVSDLNETAAAALEIISKDLKEAGWSVRPNMAFFLQDGGNNASDRIYLNDTSLIRMGIQAERELLLTRSSGCPGCEVIAGGPVNNVTSLTLSDLQINTDTAPDFVLNQFVISDAASQKVAKIQQLNGLNAIFTPGISGSFLAPAVYYEVSNTAGTDQYSLNRSDRRTTAGPQPMAENIVDFQLAYSIDGGVNWLNPPASSTDAFDPTPVNLIRLTLVARSKHRDMATINDPAYCRPVVENRTVAAGSDECGYSYRTYQTVITPRNFGMN